MPDKPNASDLPAAYRAARVLTMEPGRPLIKDAALVVDRGRVARAGPWPEVRRTFSGPVRDLGDVTLVPGLVNAHVHFELCHMAGATVQGKGFFAWVASLLPGLADGYDPALVRAEAGACRDRGTALVADVSTRNAASVARELHRAGLDFVLFKEIIGHERPGPDLLDIPEVDGGFAALAGHAPYSTSPDLLRAAKRRDADLNLPFSLHLAEHEDEVRMLADGSGEFADLLRRRGLAKGFEVPKMRPVAYADSLGLLDEKTLCVHCVHLSDEDIEVLAARRATVCLCPRSNDYIGVGRARWEDLFAAGLNLCLGTDSAASNHDLDMFAELGYFAERFNGPLDLERAVALVTANPARMLGWAGRLGGLGPGHAARWAVLPPELEDFFRIAEIRPSWERA